MRMAPRAYAPGQPPIESQIDIAKLRCVMRRIASRDTNKAVRDVVGPVGNLGSMPSTYAPMGVHTPHAGFQLSPRGLRMLGDYNSSRELLAIEDAPTATTIENNHEGREPSHIEKEK